MLPRDERRSPGSHSRGSRSLQVTAYWQSVCQRPLRQIETALEVKSLMCAGAQARSSLPRAFQRRPRKPEAPGPSGRDPRDHLDQRRLTGTRPSQAARSRPAEGLAGADRGDERGRVESAEAGDGSETARGLVFTSSRHELGRERRDAMVQLTPFEAHVLDQETGAGAQSVGGSAPSARIVTRNVSSCRRPLATPMPRSRRTARSWLIKAVRWPTGRLLARCRIWGRSPAAPHGPRARSRKWSASFLWNSCRILMGSFIDPRRSAAD